jgi:uncharacterized YigZ family protein
MLSSRKDSIMKELPEINVIDSAYKAEIKEKGSQFLSFAIPAENEEEIILNLEKLKKEYYDAAHLCYAYKLIGSFKYSDAGEPSGTAGIRIFNAIEHFNLINILLVVVRYFGGIKLGVGRLGRTYYKTAIKVLEKTDIKKKFLYQKVSIKLDFQLSQKVYHLFSNSENKILNVNYSGQASFECLVRIESLAHFLQEIRNFSGGKVQIVVSEKIYY